MIRFVICAIALACVSSSVGAVAQIAPAKIAYVEGKVFIKRGVDGTVEEAEVGTGVFRGDTVLTKPGGRAQVNLAASGVLRLSANTTISFPLGYDPTERIGVLYTGGKPWVDVKKLIREEIFEARTPTLVAGCSDAVHGNGPLSDYVVGMPVSDDQLHQSMNAGGTKSSWPSIPSTAPAPETSGSDNVELLFYDASTKTEESLARALEAIVTSQLTSDGESFKLTTKYVGKVYGPGYSRSPLRGTVVLEGSRSDDDVVTGRATWDYVNKDVRQAIDFAKFHLTGKLSGSRAEDGRLLVSAELYITRVEGREVKNLTGMTSNYGDWKDGTADYQGPDHQRPLYLRFYLP